MYIQARARRSMAFHAEHSKRLQAEEQLGHRKHEGASELAVANSNSERLFDKLEHAQAKIRHLEVRGALKMS